MQRRDVIATGTDVGGLFYGIVSKRIAVRRKNEREPCDISMWVLGEWG